MLICMIDLAGEDLSEEIDLAGGDLSEDSWDIRSPGVFPIAFGPFSGEGETASAIRKTQKKGLISL